jgi:hypothetical protein
VMIRQPAPYAAAVSLANEIGRICTWVADTAIPVLVTGAARMHGLARVIEMVDSGHTDRDVSTAVASNSTDRVAPCFAELCLEAVRRLVKFPRIDEALDPDA